MSFEGKVVLITGGAQGIGKAMALHFLQLKAAVVIADRDAEAGRETNQEYESLGWIRFIETDISHEEQVNSLFQQILNLQGRLDVLINNAGIGIFKPMRDLRLEEWNQVMGTNLTGAFLCAKYASPHLEKTSGCIINIASTRALMSEPNTESYSASKGGLVALTHALAVSLGPKVRVNCISPGWIETRPWQKSACRKEPSLSEQDHAQHPCGRVGRPEDIATLAAFLAGEQSGFITGQNYAVDGGMTKKMIYVE